jgi:hypothetical protein
MGLDLYETMKRAPAVVENGSNTILFSSKFGIMPATARNSLHSEEMINLRCTTKRLHRSASITTFLPNAGSGNEFQAKID